MNNPINDIITSIPKWRTVMPVAYVAKKLNVSANTVRKLIESGKLEALRLPIGKDGVYRITQNSLERFLKNEEKK